MKQQLSNLDLDQRVWTALLDPSNTALPLLWIHTSTLPLNSLRRCLRVSSGIRLIA